MRRVCIACFDAGGGHRAAARALMDAIRRLRPDWRVEILNVDDVLVPVDPIHRLTGTRGGELYNWSLRRGWTIGSGQVISVMHGVIRLLHSQQVRLLREAWRAARPDLVLSVIPHFNRALFESLRQEAPGTPFVTAITDFADYPPHFWVENETDRNLQHVICGSELAVSQAYSAGFSEDRIWRVSGMILHPRFCEPVKADRQAERRRIGLDPYQPTGVALFGGYGSESMIEIARSTEAAKLGVQLIFLCGRNHELAKRLRRMKLSYKFHVEDFTEKVAHYMWLSDFFIGKPGPGSMSEALAMELPLIVEAGLKTLAQERYNVRWIREQGVGIPVARAKNVPAAVANLLEPATYSAMRLRIQRHKNRAVFEIVDLLDNIVAQNPSVYPPAHRFDPEVSHDRV